MVRKRRDKEKAKVPVYQNDTLIRLLSHRGIQSWLNGKSVQSLSVRDCITPKGRRGDQGRRKKSMKNHFFLSVVLLPVVPPLSSSPLLPSLQAAALALLLQAS